MSAITVTKKNFTQEILNASTPVLIDFWAPWCGPCRRVAPIVDEIGHEAEGKIKVGKINIDEEPELAQQFNVMSIPTLVVMKNGKVKNSAIGARSKAAILELLD